MKELEPGSRINNYTLIDLLGQTAMGQVWRARVATGGTVALKTIASHAENYERLRERFLREIAIHQNLQHPAIVPIHDFFEYEERLYLIMEYVPGGSLENRLDNVEGRKLQVQEALSISRQILYALDYAHQNYIIHRDVKPSNILLDGGRALLADFGISLPVGAPRLTSAKQIVGTPYYMSPEQIVTPHAVNHLTDVFSYGCVLYEMLAGQPPFADESDTESTPYHIQQARQAEAIVPPLRPFNPDVSERLERIVMTSLARNPEDRFLGCGSFANALEWAGQEWQTPRMTPNPAPTPQAEVIEPAVAVPQKLFDPAVTPTATKRPSRVSVQGNFILVLLAGLAPLAAEAMEARDAVIVVSLVSALVINIVLLILLYKGWTAIQDGHARVRPRQAVGFLLIPIFNSVWCWIAYLGFASDYNAFVDRYQIQARKQPKALYIAFVITQYMLLYVVGYFKGIIGWYFAISVLMAAGMCVNMARGINALSEPEAKVPPAAMAKSAQVLR